MNSTFQLLDLPDIVLEKILSFLSYDSIAKNRLVCKKFDNSCRALLNRGFLSAERKQVAVSRSIKLCLPRRESERKSHPLARHCEILAALETRISMLNMTFMKFIQNGLCCFIPGKIIDEILYILRVVKRFPNPPRTHDLLQELRDISSMAMEHFEEHIVPNLKSNEVSSSKGYNLPGTSLVITQMPRSMIPELLRKELKNFHQLSKSHHNQLCGLKKIIKCMSTKIKRQNNLIACQSSRMREQKRVNQQQASDMLEMRRRLEELEVKFADLSTEVTQSRVEQPSENKSSQTVATTENDDEPEFVFPTIDMFRRDDSYVDDLRHERLENRIRRTLSELAPFDRYRPKNVAEPDILRRIRANARPRIVQRKICKAVQNLKSQRGFVDIARMSDVCTEKMPKRRETVRIEKSQETSVGDRNKRSIIDLIANVADSKVDKHDDEDPREIARFLDEFPMSRVSDTESPRGVKRGLNDSGRYPRKKFAESLV